MLTLQSPIKLVRGLEREANIASRFDERDLDAIGAEVWNGYERDEISRGPWLEKTDAALRLAMQIRGAKSFPWPKASNVAFPLLTIAALQFHSRAYPALFASQQLVRYKVPGIDKSGQLHESAHRVARFMSYQANELDQAFEEQHDRLLINVPIVGCGFIKTRHDFDIGTPISEFVSAKDLVIDYFAKSVDTALRKTQVLCLYKNEVYERCASGRFLDVREEPWYSADATVPQRPTDQNSDRAAGLTPPVTEPGAMAFLEQHTWLDLDADGYAEPYIVTIHWNTRKVVRIVTRWERPEDILRVGARQEVLRIVATEYYTKYGLVPSVDGSIYDTGFGALVGPLNENVNTLVNQLTDAGTLANTAGGFLAKGVKLRGGPKIMQPFGWETVESSFDDLRKGIVPAPVREPSAVLFNLLTLLINYTQRIGGANDAMVGENPGQNTPAFNMRTMVEQGTKVYSAVFKRLWRSMREELKKRYILNGKYLPDSVPFGEEAMGRSDFLGDPSSVSPFADPNLSDDVVRMQQATAVREASRTVPGYNRDNVERNYLRAMGIDSVEEFYSGTEGMQPPKDPKIVVEEMRQQVKREAMQMQHDHFIAQLDEQMRANDAKIVESQAKAATLMAQLKDGGDQKELEAVKLQIEGFRARNEALQGQREWLLRNRELDQTAAANASESDDAGE